MGPHYYSPSNATGSTQLCSVAESVDIHAALLDGYHAVSRMICYMIDKTVN